MTTKNIKIIEGKVKENPYGDWSDVDKGVYVGNTCIVFNTSNYPYLSTFLSDYIGMNVKITIEVLEDES